MADVRKLNYQQFAIKLDGRLIAHKLYSNKKGADVCAAVECKINKKMPGLSTAVKQ